MQNTRGQLIQVITAHQNKNHHVLTVTWNQSKHSRESKSFRCIYLSATHEPADVYSSNTKQPLQDHDDNNKHGRSHFSVTNMHALHVNKCTITKGLNKYFRSQRMAVLTCQEARLWAQQRPLAPALRRYANTRPRPDETRTKCRRCRGHMTPLFSENRLSHKRADKTWKLYPKRTQRVPALPKRPSRAHNRAVGGRNPSCLSRGKKKWRPFYESLRRGEKKKKRRRATDRIKLVN